MLDINEILCSALDLLYGMVSKKTLMEIVKKLMANVGGNQLGNKYRDDLISKIVDICSQNDYQFITNFEWYVSVLVDLARVEGGTEHGNLLAQQLLDVAIRVESIRPFATQQTAVLLQNCHLFVNSTPVCEVLYAAAWICGEFSEHLAEPRDVLVSMLPEVVFPAHIESVFLHNATKIFVKLAKDPDEDFTEFCADLVAIRLQRFLSSENLEVQERATNLLQLISFRGSLSGEELENLLHSYALNPVAAKAQKKVPVPLGLDLDQEFVVVDVESDNEIDAQVSGMGFSKESDDEYDKNYEEDEETVKQAKEARRVNEEHNPNYLKVKKGKKKAKKSKSTESEDHDDGDAVEVAEEAVVLPKSDSGSRNSSPDSIPGLASSDAYVNLQSEKKSKKKKGKKQRDLDASGDEDEELARVEHKVTITGLEMPDGADMNEVEDSDDDSPGALADPHRALARVTLDYPAPVVEVPPGLKIKPKKKKSSKSRAEDEPSKSTKVKKKKTKSKKIVI